MRLNLLICVCFIALNVTGQSNLTFGSWESHLPFQRGISVTQSDSKVYYATESAIMSIDKEDLSLEYISKVEGLSSLGISKLKYDPFSGNMVVIYQDSDMDIITEEGIINIADIKNNRGIFGDKRVNDVHFNSDNKAYFSAGFGVVSFDMNRFEFGFTTQMGLRVNAVTTDNNKLYAATEDGIYVLDLNENYNFGDFGNWDFLSSEVGLPLTYDAIDIAYFGGTLFALIGRRVYQLKDGLFEPIFTGASGEEVLFLNESGKELIVGVRTPSQFKSRLIFIDSEFIISEGTSECANFILDAIMEDNGRIWYADEWNNFRYTDGKEGNCQRFTAPSPYSHNASELRVQDKVLYVASGGVTEGFNFLSNRDGVYIFEDGQWNNYNEANNGAMQQGGGMVNSFVITPDPLGEYVYVGSFFNGLLKVNFKTGMFEHFYSENSPITGPQGSPSIEKVSGLVFDKQGNLWISVYEADRPLVALTPEGTFHSYNIPASTRIGQIIVDDFGYLWIQVTGASGGILVFDNNNTVKDPSDDRFRFINTSNSRLKSNSINCLEVDREGDVWVGTASGPIIFECGDPFDIENCVGSIRTVLEDSIPAELLITEDVRSIAIDGADRKWIGSRNGIFVQSPNGTEKVDRFTTDNSPLFDNNIIDMAFDGDEGIMYIATNGGIQAYKTETTEGGRFHQRNAYAFPNPVRPGFEGLIAIRGLARDATVKITDIKGQLVYETEALGGQALWDGRDYSGRMVSSGVYLVFSNSRDIFEDPNTAVTKILIVR